MSNYLAIATVTETLRQLLNKVVTEDVTGATATAVRPIGTGAGLPEVGVNVFLYQVLPNTSRRNDELPTRRDDSSVVQRARAAFDLCYLLSFYGKDIDQEPQRVMGTVLRTLNEQPLLTRKMIQDAVGSAAFLAGSDLADEAESVRLMPTSLSLEEVSKLWSVLLQTPFVLSVVYQASVVFLDGKARPAPALPVKDRNIYVMPFAEPVISRILSRSAPGATASENQPILPGYSLVLQGEHLQGDVTQLRFAGALLVPDAESPTELEILLQEPPFPTKALRVGLQPVQVVQQINMGTPPTPHQGFESGVAAFILHPVISTVTATGAKVDLNVNPQLGSGQRALLVLNEQTAVGPKAYSFAVPTSEAEKSSISVPISGVKPALYFARLQVDGAESALESVTIP